MSALETPEDFIVREQPLARGNGALVLTGLIRARDEQIVAALADARKRHTSPGGCLDLLPYVDEVEAIADALRGAPPGRADGHVFTDPGDSLKRCACGACVPDGNQCRLARAGGAP